MNHPATQSTIGHWPRRISSAKRARCCSDRWTGYKRYDDGSRSRKSRTRNVHTTSKCESSRLAAARLGSPYCPNLEVPPFGRLEGKMTLVTGAGRGIGALIVRTSIREGARVYVTDIANDEVALPSSIFRRARHGRHTCGGRVCIIQKRRRAITPRALPSEPVWHARRRRGDGAFSGLRGIALCYRFGVVHRRRCARRNSDNADDPGRLLACFICRNAPSAFAGVLEPPSATTKCGAAPLTAHRYTEKSFGADHRSGAKRATFCVPGPHAYSKGGSLSPRASRMNTQRFTSTFDIWRSHRFCSPAHHPCSRLLHSRRQRMGRVPIARCIRSDATRGMYSPDGCPLGQRRRSLGC
jgi:hypothetical protein